MANAVELVEDLARQLADEVGGSEGARARRLAERLASGTFFIAVVGEFKRGKSTLVNALVGETVLPTGVLPLTAVATELSFGDPSSRVVFLDGHTEEVPRDRLPTYITEAGNPDNRLGVARAVLRGRWPLLEPGAVLVDTPGLASLHEHNTSAGRAALLDADGAIIVLSADAPLSGDERHLLELLRGRRSPTFLVLNKADHLTRGELLEVQAFLGTMVFEIVGTSLPIFAVDARSAAARPAGAPSARFEFEAFRAAVSTFITEDLGTAVVASARQELARLGSSILDRIAIERTARSVAADELDRLADRFADEATRQRAGFTDDRTLVARDISALQSEMAERLGTFGRAAPDAYLPALADAAAAAPRAHLVDALRAIIEDAVESSFDRYREETLAWVDERWKAIADAFRSRVQERVDAARRAASELFDVPLPHSTIPDIADQKNGFSFLFVQVDSTTEPLERFASRLVPDRMARRRVLARAEVELRSEFDKHAGRAVWDLTQRLDSARRSLERAMRTELEDSIAAVVEAAERARRWQSRSREDRVRADERADELAALASELTSLSSAPI